MLPLADLYKMPGKKFVEPFVLHNYNAYIPCLCKCKKCCHTLITNLYRLEWKNQWIKTLNITFWAEWAIWQKKKICIFFPWATLSVASYMPLSWSKEMHLLKSNFLSSQMVSHSFSPSSLPLHKAKWVQLNGKTLQVLKNSLGKARYFYGLFRSSLVLLISH